MLLEELLLKWAGALKYTAPQHFPLTDARRIMGSLLNVQCHRPITDYENYDPLTSDANRDFSVGGPTHRPGVDQTLINTAERAQGFDTVNSFLGSLDEGAQKLYSRQWKRRLHFCRVYNVQTRLTTGWIEWRGILIKFITYGRSVVKLNSSSILGEIASIRYHHILDGAMDFPTQGVRYKQLLKALAKWPPVLRK